MEKEMELNNQDNIGNSLEQDRAWAESLLNKQSLSELNASKTDAPIHYFESFPDKLMSRIANERLEKLEKKNAKIFFLPSFMQPLNRLAIAAAFIIVVGGSFIFLNNDAYKKIESYVDANEWIAEIDVQAQMQKENAKLSTLDEKQIEEIQKIINK